MHEQYLGTYNITEHFPQKTFLAILKEIKRFPRQSGKGNCFSPTILYFGYPTNANVYRGALQQYWDRITPALLLKILVLQRPM